MVTLSERMWKLVFRLSLLKYIKQDKISVNSTHRSNPGRPDNVSRRFICIIFERRILIKIDVTQIHE